MSPEARDLLSRAGRQVSQENQSLGTAGGKETSPFCQCSLMPLEFEWFVRKSLMPPSSISQYDLEYFSRFLEVNKSASEKTVSAPTLTKGVGLVPNQPWLSFTSLWSHNPWSPKFAFLCLYYFYTILSCGFVYMCTISASMIYLLS